MGTTHRLFFSVICLWLGFLGNMPLQAQSTYTQDTTLATEALPKISTKVTYLAAGAGLAYVGGLFVLNEAWYKEGERSAFHWFNDSHEWKQIDKVGHFWSSFHLSRLGVDALRGAGFSEKKAIWWGSAMGLALLTPIEYFDGRSPAYGASASDIAANAAGSLAVLGQQLAWQEIRITPKFSFHTTKYAAQRPNVLGNGFPEEVLKDYNGHTYWLSVDVVKFLPANSMYPKWLNVAAGYGAEEMVYNDLATNRRLGFNAHRQYYLSLDLNWQAIPTQSKFLKGAFYVLNIFKFPAPALEYSRPNGLKGHWLYF
ncbi:DUF2279 domain-containing protein [Rufibacter sp. LB8]|uniref:DUF2279 domain-containing protein n=2 Tax=Rufibacter sp. LB8 TaxID=2777781 RepID=UPI00351C5076